MNEIPFFLKRYFEYKFFCLQDFWLRECLETICRKQPALLNYKNDYPKQKALIRVIYNRFLSSELSTSSVPVLPPDTPKIERSFIKGPIILQIVDILEIGTSTQKLLDTIGTIEEGYYKQRLKYIELQKEPDKLISFPRAMLWITLTDGEQTVQGMEDKIILDLSMNTSVGKKIIISNVEVILGVLILTPYNTRILGGGHGDVRPIEELQKKFLLRLGKEVPIENHNTNLVSGNLGQLSQISDPQNNNLRVANLALSNPQSDIYIDNKDVSNYDEKEIEFIDNESWKASDFVPKEHSGAAFIPNIHNKNSVYPIIPSQISDNNIGPRIDYPDDFPVSKTTSANNQESRTLNFTDLINHEQGNRNIITSTLKDSSFDNESTEIPDLTKDSPESNLTESLEKPKLSKMKRLARKKPQTEPASSPGKQNSNALAQSQLSSYFPSLSPKPTTPNRDNERKLLAYFPIISPKTETPKKRLFHEFEAGAIGSPVQGSQLKEGLSPTKDNQNSRPRIDKPPSKSSTCEIQDLGNDNSAQPTSEVYSVSDNKGKKPNLEEPCFDETQDNFNDGAKYNLHSSMNQGVTGQAEIETEEDIENHIMGFELDRWEKPDDSFGKSMNAPIYINDDDEDIPKHKPYIQHENSIKNHLNTEDPFMFDNETQEIDVGKMTISDWNYNEDFSSYSPICQNNHCDDVYAQENDLIGGAENQDYTEDYQMVTTLDGEDENLSVPGDKFNPDPSPFALENLPNRPLTSANHIEEISELRNQTVYEPGKETSKAQIVSPSLSDLEEEEIWDPELRDEFFEKIDDDFVNQELDEEEELPSAEVLLDAAINGGFSLTEPKKQSPITPVTSLPCFLSPSKSYISPIKEPSYTEYPNRIKKENDQPYRNTSSSFKQEKWTEPLLPAQSLFRGDKKFQDETISSLIKSEGEDTINVKGAIFCRLSELREHLPTRDSVVITVKASIFKVTKFRDDPANGGLFLSIDLDDGFSKQSVTLNQKLLEGMIGMNSLKFRAIVRNNSDPKQHAHSIIEPVKLRLLTFNNVIIKLVLKNTTLLGIANFNEIYKLPEVVYIQGLN
ncbi:hypothetical protein G9A89_010862 [Geosiphon pyriformis]|nr:hypothetical protein G9A89_010862 [Geosiphon pyriformis]